jgi:hypothetical protein
MGSQQAKTQQPIQRPRNFFSATATFVPFALFFLNLFHYIWRDEDLVSGLLITNMLNALYLLWSRYAGL